MYIQAKMNKYSAFSVPHPMSLYIYKRDNKSALCAFAIFHEGPWGLKAKIKCFLRTTNPFNGVGIRNTLFNFLGLVFSNITEYQYSVIMYQMYFVMAYEHAQHIIQCSRYCSFSFTQTDGRQKSMQSTPANFNLSFWSSWGSILKIDSSKGMTKISILPFLSLFHHLN